MQMALKRCSKLDAYYVQTSRATDRQVFGVWGVGYPARVVEMRPKPSRFVVQVSTFLYMPPGASDAATAIFWTPTPVCHGPQRARAADASA